MKILPPSKQLVTLCLLASACSALIAQQAANQQTPPITVEQIKGNIYQVKGGSGANAGFFVCEKEVVVIDAKMTEESARQMLKEIEKVSPLPVRKILLTHSDGDHVNGLTGFPEGIDIMAHENTCAQVAAAFRTDNQRKHLPNLTFSDRLFISTGSDSMAERIQLLYFGPAHTDGDIIVYFPVEKTAFAGDLLFLTRDPLIHRAKNGTSSGLVKVLKAILSLDVETILSGHNEPATKKDIMKLIASIEEKQVRIGAMVREGKTLDDVKAAFRVDDQPGRTGTSRMPSFVEVIYLELSQNK
jgi:glyoxylase-like metal-dependent hydrolase (beta-lactamase superfamily II)